MILKHGLPWKFTPGRIGRPNNDSESIEISANGFGTESASMQGPHPCNTCRRLVKEIERNMAGTGPFVITTASRWLLSHIPPCLGLVRPLRKTANSTPQSGKLALFVPVLATRSMFLTSARAERKHGPKQGWGTDSDGPVTGRDICGRGLSLTTYRNERMAST